MKNLSTALLVAVVALGGGATSVVAQSQQQLKELCANEHYSVPVDRRANSCSALIQSGRLSKTELAVTFTYRGDTYLQRNDYDQAIADYSEAIRNNPNYGRAWSSRGMAYRSNGDLNRAMQDFDEGIRLDPNYLAAHWARHYAYLTAGDYDRAIADCTQAVEINPSVYAYFVRSQAYLLKGDKAAALADINKAIALNPKYASGYFIRGLINFYDGSLPKALANFKQAAVLDPRDAYNALWLDIVAKRSNLPSRLGEAANSTNASGYLRSIMDLYTGRKTIEAVLATVDAKTDFIKQFELCDVNFFGGEQRLSLNDKEGAKRLLNAAVATCRKVAAEWQWWAADSELKALSGGM